MNTIEHCHTALRDLLPWYVNGTLGEAENKALKDHLAVCDDCAEACQQERRLAKAVSATPDNAPDAGNALADLEAGQDFERPRRGFARKKTFNVPWLPGIAIAQAAVIVALAASLIIIMNPAGVPASYHTVSDAPNSNALGRNRATFAVVFAPETQQATLTALLKRSNAQIIAGPNAAGAYTLAISTNASAARSRFQASPMVDFVGALTPAHE